MILLWSVSCVPFQNPKLTLETTVNYVAFYKWFSSGASSSNKSGIFLFKVLEWKMDPIWADPDLGAQVDPRAVVTMAQTMVVPLRLVLIGV